MYDLSQVLFVSFRLLIHSRCWRDPGTFEEPMPPDWSCFFLGLFVKLLLWRSGEGRGSCSAHTKKVHRNNAVWRKISDELDNTSPFHDWIILPLHHNTYTRIQHNRQGREGGNRGGARYVRWRAGTGYVRIWNAGRDCSKRRLKTGALPCGLHFMELLL